MLDSIAAPPIPLMRAVIKEELCKLTGDPIKALLLNQFIYWSERTRDIDRYLAEETSRMLQGRSWEEGNVPPTNGWIYKSAEDLIQETMLDMSQATMGRHMRVLVEKEYLQCRTNPDHKWDRTKQYRVNYVKIVHDLAELGYTLEGYVSMQLTHAFFTRKNEHNVVKNRNFKMKNRDFKIKNRDPKMKNQTFENERAIPEITTEITTEKIKNPDAHRPNEGLESLDPVDWMQRYSEQTRSIAALESLVEENEQRPTPDVQANPLLVACDLVSEVITRRTSSPVGPWRNEEVASVAELLDQGLSVESLRMGAEFALDQFERHHQGETLRAPIRYCLTVIADRLRRDMERPVAKPKPLSRHAPRRWRTNPDRVDRDPRYEAFYELFPDG